MFTGLAAILQKVSASKEAHARSLSPGLLWRLAHNPAYIGSLLLDLAGGGLAIVAERSLPLFLVQAIVASGVAWTALGDRVFLKHHLHGRTYAYIGVLLAGLLLLGISATPATKPHIDTFLRWFVLSMPFALAGVSASLVRLHGWIGSIGLAFCSGLAFGGTAIVGRTLPFPQPLWHIVFEPFAWALAAYGILAVFLLTLALQRASATIATATMEIAQTLLPTVVGFVLLGDTIGHGLTPVFALGGILALVGTGGVISLEKP